MKVYTKIVLGAALAVFLAGPLHAQQGSSGGDFKKVGASGGQFLKIGVGARATGMAGAYGGVADDATAVYWNPAGVADVKSIGGNFTYNNWLAGFSHNFIGATLPIGESYTAAAHIISLSSGNIPIATIEQSEGTGSFYTVSDIAVGATISGYLTEQFAFGVTAKYIQHSFASLTSSGMAFDIGTSYKTGISGIRLGFSIHNLGGDQEYSGTGLSTQNKLNQNQSSTAIPQEIETTPFKLPLSFRAGIATNLLEGDENNAWIVAADFETLSDIPEQYSIGTEYTWNNLFAVRGGYRFGHDQLGLSGGAGIKYVGGGFAGSMDYSVTAGNFSDFSPALGFVHRLSVGLQLR